MNGYYIMYEIMKKHKHWDKKKLIEHVDNKTMILTKDSI